MTSPEWCPEVGDKIWFLGCWQGEALIPAQPAIFLGLRLSGYYSVFLVEDLLERSFQQILFEPMRP